MGAALVSGVPISYSDSALMLSDCGVSVGHTTLFRWLQAYAGALEQRIRRHLRPCTGSWRVDETNIKTKGAWTCYEAMGMIGKGRLTTSAVGTCQHGPPLLQISSRLPLEIIIFQHRPASPLQMRHHGL